MPAAIVAAKADPSQKRRAFRPGQDHTATETGSILRVFPTGGKRWVWRGTVQGRRRDFGLGSYPTVSLKGARTKASPPCCSASMAGELPKQVGQSLRRDASAVVGDGDRHGQLAAWRSPGWWTTQVSACALSRPSLRSVTTRSSEQWVLPYGTYLIRVFAKEALILGTLDTVSTGSDGSQV